MPTQLDPEKLAINCRAFRDLLKAFFDIGKMPDTTEDLVRLLTAAGESPQVAELLCERILGPTEPVGQPQPVAGMWPGRDAPAGGTPSMWTGGRTR